MKLRRLEFETPVEAEARKLRHNQAAAKHRAATKTKPQPSVQHTEVLPCVSGLD